MPIWLRNATFNWEKEWYSKQKEENEKQNNLVNNPNKQEIKIPDYVSKASKK